MVKRQEATKGEVLLLAVDMFQKRTRTPAIKICEPTDTSFQSLQQFDCQFFVRAKRPTATSLPIYLFTTPVHVFPHVHV